MYAAGLPMMPFSALLAYFSAFFASPFLFYPASSLSATRVTSMASLCLE